MESADPAATARTLPCTQEQSAFCREPWRLHAGIPECVRCGLYRPAEHIAPHYPLPRHPAEQST